MILLGTDSPDYTTPATSVVVYRNWAWSTPAPSISAARAPRSPPGRCRPRACSPPTRNTRPILVIGARSMHKLSDLEISPVSFYYGDGAGAAAPTASDKPGASSARPSSPMACTTRIPDTYRGGTLELSWPLSKPAQAGRAHVCFLTPFPAPRASAPRKGRAGGEVPVHCNSTCMRSTLQSSPRCATPASSSPRPTLVYRP